MGSLPELQGIGAYSYGMNQPRRPSPAVARRRQLLALIVGVFLAALVVWGVREAWVFFASDDETDSEQDQGETDQEATGQDGTNQDAEDPGQGSSHADAQAGSEPEADDPTEDSHEDTEQQGEAEAAPEGEPEMPEGYCQPSDITITASTREDSYGADEAPLLVMEIENTGSQECTVDVGTAEQTWHITHGGDEIFTINQCDFSRDSYEIELEPEQSENAQFSWPRSDSNLDCTQPAPLPGGDYELTVGISGITSTPHTFEMAGTEE